MAIIGNIILIVLQLYSFVLIARVLMSYFPTIDRSNPIVQGLYQITEPVLQPVRERLPQNSYGMDLSPLAVFAIIFIVQIFVRAIFF